MESSFQSLFEGNPYNKSPIYAGNIKGIQTPKVKKFIIVFSVAENSGSLAKKSTSLKKGETKLKIRYTKKKLNQNKPETETKPIRTPTQQQDFF